MALVTRKFGSAFPKIVTQYAGDVLTGVFGFFGIRSLFPTLSLPYVALIAYFTCVSIEVLQLYQAPWIQAVRHTPPFGLLLGYGFLWSDVLCYALGTIITLMIAYILENKIRRRGSLNDARDKQEFI